LPREINRNEPLVDLKGRATQYMQSVILDIDRRIGLVANNVKIINSLSDFEYQTATTITLKSGYTYIIGAFMSTGKRFIVENGVGLTSGNGFTLSLEYTGTLPMFTSSNANWLIEYITINCPNADIFDVSGNGIHIFNTAAVVAAKKIGTFNGSGQLSVNWENVNFISLTESGMLFTGTFNVLSISRMTQVTSGSTHIGIDLDSAVFSTIELENLELFGVLGSYGLKIAANSANIVNNVIGTVQSTNMQRGSMVALTGGTSKDVRWEFLGNTGISDTLEDALIYFRNNVTNTVITTINTPVLVAGTWLDGGRSKFSFTSAGTLTSLSQRTYTAPIDVSLTCRMASAGNCDVTVYLAKNGSIITATGLKQEVSSSVSKSIPLIWQPEFSEDDYFQVFIENNTSTVDILVEQITLRVR